VVRCIPWDCSDRRLRLIACLTAALASLLLPAAPAVADLRWKTAVFPVAVFSGYTSHYGLRVGPKGGSEVHRGIDIAAPLGSPIRSWWGGVVKELINDAGCGVGLVIQSGPYEHLYCHLAGSLEAGRYRSGQVVLQVGSRVRSGQGIGHVGMSGRSTGPHLHWGVRYGSQWVDPVLVLRAMARARRG
jgi:murein DD-endopeptidase MepM/ murein hydrolase activator NlpD